jgi:hypothetical protein
VKSTKDEPPYNVNYLDADVHACTHKRGRSRAHVYTLTRAHKTTFIFLTDSELSNSKLSLNWSSFYIFVNIILFNLLVISKYLNLINALRIISKPYIIGFPWILMSFLVFISASAPLLMPIRDCVFLLGVH